ncbi:MAG: immunoglobulin domain-containing protein [Opitutaceae bacterium]|jgi:glycerophosphoryl diester phosphodiesterase|nr:immunoglobulin domain-containing protein [Opitutaceae bacterium]
MLLAILQLIAFLFLPQVAAANSPADPILITDAAGFDAIRGNLSAHYRLAADIDLSAFAAGRGWEPIGTPAAPFTGSLDGSGHRITGLVVNRPATGKRVEITGHKGACWDAPENTLAAFNAAWTLGADSVETDVVLTKDMKLATVHGDDIPGNDGCKVSQMTLDEIRELDVGGWWFGPNGPYAGERVPLLEEIFATIPDGGVCYIDIKNNNWYLASHIIPEINAAFLASGCQPSQVAITCVNPYIAAQTKELWPDHISQGCLQGGYDVYNYETVSNAVRTWEYAVDRINLYSHYNADGTSYCNATLFRLADDFGYEMGVSVVDDPAEMAQHIAAGAFDVTTNRVGWLREQLNGMGALPDRDCDHAGLFGCVRNAVFKNLHLVAPQVAGRNFTGALAGYADGSGTSVERCSVQGGVVTSGNTAVTDGVESETGALLGINYYGTVRDCYATADVRGARRVGGLLGTNHGGLVERCFASGNITGRMETGGLLGRNRSGSVRNAFALAPRVTAQGRWPGRVVGRNIDGAGADAATLAAWEGAAALAPDNTARTFTVDAPAWAGAPVNGGSLTAGELRTRAAFEALGFDFTVSGNWDWTAGNYPVLRGVSGQTDTLAIPPAILVQPQGGVFFRGDSHTFTVTATGDAPLSYQWLRDNLPLPGATNATLSLASITLADAGPYTVTVSNPNGGVTSVTADLTVRLTSDDFLAYALKPGAEAEVFPGDGGLSHLPRVTLSGDALSMTFLPARAGHVYQVEKSNDLATWEPVGAPIIPAADATVGTTPVTVPSSEPVSEAPRQFLRLKIRPPSQ